MGNSIRANWHVGDLNLPDSDPLQEMHELESSATVIDLTTTEAELRANLQTYLRWEGRVQSRGNGEQGCELKWQPQHMLAGQGGSLTCFNCPHADPEERVICKIGRSQCALVEEIAGLKIADKLDAVIGAAHARAFAASAELADYALA
jgi:hypothetical protein